MTTQFSIGVPKQNHKRVLVEWLDVDEDGNETVFQLQTLEHGEFAENFYIYDSRKYRISEVD